jgi:CHASE1-domain containing sensor protein
LERSFTGPAPLSRSDFHHLAQSLLQRVPTIQAVKWAPRIDLGQRAAYESAQQAELPGFEIREVDSSGRPHHAGARAYYYPVTYVEPIAGNESALGFDLESNRDRATATEAAVKTGTVAATAPISVVEKTGQQTGMLLIFAVHNGPNGPGVLIVALQMGTFMEELLASVNTMIGVRLVDLDGNRPLYRSFVSAPRETSYEETFSFGGRRYDVRTAPTPSYLERHRRWQSWGVLVVGVFSTGLLGALLMLGTGYTRRIERVVDNVCATSRRLTGACKSRSGNANRPKRHCAKRREWRQSVSLPAVSRMTSTTCLRW